MTQVLIVDDDDATRDVLRAALEDEGYGVSEAANGHDALALLRASQQPQVVLLDLHMPEGDGAQVLAAVHAEARLARRHRYLAMTALPPRAITLCDDLRRLLAAPLIPKPFDIDTLLAAVAQAAAHLPRRRPASRPARQPEASPMPPRGAAPRGRRPPPPAPGRRVSQ